MAMTQWMTYINIVLVSFLASITIASKFWYEIKKVKGPRPSPRYRHTAVICGGSMVIFGGVDTT